MVVPASLLLSIYSYFFLSKASNNIFVMCVATLRLSNSMKLGPEVDFTKTILIASYD